MQEKQIEDIKNSLREVMQLLVQRGQPLSEELKTKLAQVMEHAANRIIQLRQEQTKKGEATPELEEAEAEQAEVAEEVTPAEEPPTPSEPIPELKPAPHESSNINAFRYEGGKDGKLYVKFQDKYPGKNGPVYVYEGVPSFVFATLKKGAIPPKTSGSNAWHTWKKGVMPSHGAAMFEMIKKGGYPYKKLS